MYQQSTVKRYSGYMDEKDEEGKTLSLIEFVTNFYILNCCTESWAGT